MSFGLPWTRQINVDLLIFKEPTLEGREGSNSGGGGWGGAVFFLITGSGEILRGEDYCSLSEPRT